MKSSVTVSMTLAIAIILMFVTCDKTDKEITLPTVTTAEVTDIAQSHAKCGGNVTSHGNAPVTARGVCWSTVENPTTEDNHTEDGIGEGAFTSSITGLAPSGSYFVRAYATNSKGTVYGSQREFQTPL